MLRAVAALPLECTLRRSRGYWQPGGAGYHKFVMAMQRHAGNIAAAARAMGMTYGHAYAVAMRNKLRREFPVHDRTLLLRSMDTQDIDYSQCLMAKAYGWKGRMYGSEAAHVSRAGPELAR